MPNSASLIANTPSVSAPLALRGVRIVCATAAVALAAHVAFPLPFTPVPFTLQPLAVLGVGLALGPVEGALAMMAYLAEGAMGLPVFAPIGFGGAAQLLGPTGGYLLAYPAVAFLSGSITGVLGKKLRPFPAALVACTVATLFLFLCGATWLEHLTHMDGRHLWIAAIGPFLPGEAVKVLAAAGTYRALKKAPQQHTPTRIQSDWKSQL